MSTVEVEGLPRLKQDQNLDGSKEIPVLNYTHQ